jgi:hypothetical protein
VANESALSLAERRMTERIGRKEKEVLANVDSGGVRFLKEGISRAQEPSANYDPVTDGLYVQLALIDLPVASVANEFIPTPDNTVRGPGEVLGKLKAVGRQLFLAYSAALRKLVCEKGDEELRQKLIEAISAGSGISIISGALISIGVSSAAAPIVAALILTVLVKPTRDQLCKMWAESLGPTI